MKIPKLIVGRLRPDLRERYHRVQAAAEAAITKTAWVKSDQHVVVTTKLDLRHFQTLIARYPKVKELVARAEDEYPAFGSMLQDIYFVLYLAQVKLRTRKELAPSFRINVDLMERVLALDVFQFTRQHSRLNEGKSWIGMVEIAETILEGFPEELKEECREQARQQAKSEQDRQELEDLINELDNLANPPEDPSDEEQEEAGNTLDESQEDEPEDQAPAAGDQPPVGEDVTPDAEGEGNDPGQGDEGDSEGENEDASPNMPGDTPGSGAGGSDQDGESDLDSDDANGDGGDRETEDESGQSSGGNGTGDGDKDNDPSEEESPLTGQGTGDDETEDLERQAQDEFERALEDLLNEIEAKSQEINDLREPELDEETGDRLRRLARRSLKEANEELDELADAMSSWGIEDGEWNEIPLEDRLDLAEKLTKVGRMDDFVAELGRMRHEALNALKQPGALDRQEVVGIAIGGDINNLLPEELMNLMDPDLEMLFYANVFQEEALEHLYAGRAPSGDGPWIVCADVSSSMRSGKALADRWSKAFIISSLEIARKKNRDVAIIFFDTKIQHTMVIPGGNATPIQKLQIATGFAGGGTDWRPALEAALVNIEDQRGPWKTADIVLVTDGVCELPDEFATIYSARTKAIGVRTHGILVDVGKWAVKMLEPFCDQAYSVSSLAGVGEASPIFQKLALKRS